MIAQHGTKRRPEYLGPGLSVALRRGTLIAMGVSLWGATALAQAPAPDGRSDTASPAAEANESKSAKEPPTEQTAAPEDGASDSPAEPQTAPESADAAADAKEGSAGPSEAAPDETAVATEPDADTSAPSSGGDGTIVNVPPSLSPYATAGADPAATEAAWRELQPKRRTDRQGEFAFGGAYSMGLSVARTRDFISNFSPNGFNVVGRYFLDQYAAVGFMTGYQGFSAKTRSTETFDDDNIAVTATQLRYFDTVPLLATLHRYADFNEAFSGFLGLGLGAQWTRREVDTGLQGLRYDSDWHFGLALDAGTMFRLSEGLNLTFDCRYHYAVRAPRSENEMYFTFNVGLLGY